MKLNISSVAIVYACLYGWMLV